MTGGIAHTAPPRRLRRLHRALALRLARSLTLAAALPALAIAQARQSAAPAATDTSRGSRTGGSRPGLDVQHYDFRVDFSPRGLDDTVRVASTITVYRSARADTLLLDLRQAMRVDAAEVNGASVPIVRDSVSVKLPLPTGVRDTLRVALRYRGRPTDGLVIRRDAAGQWTAFADHFPDRAREWLATVDHPSDKATVEWTVRTPAGYRVIANGELQEETPQPATAASPAMLLTRWKSTRPLYTGVMVIGVASFAQYELGRTACGLAETPGCVPQSVWVTPDVRDYMPGPFAKAGDMVALYSRLIGPYPYEKLAHVQSSTRYGGMENASSIFYADNIFRQRTMSEGLIAHETVHQWFGDAVTTAAWPHVWLSEGFATYFAAVWAERSRGDSAMLNEVRRMRQSVLEAPVTVEKPVIDETLSDLRFVLNSNVYQKAGFVLHMLRHEAGDSAFFQAVRAYYARHRHGNALTADFVRQVEASSGRELGWFFDQWMRRPGYAELTAGWNWDAGRKALLLTVSQGTRFPPYQLNLSLDVTDAQGRVQRIRVSLPAARVATVPVPVTLSGAPLRVVFDPDATLLGTLTVQ